MRTRAQISGHLDKPVRVGTVVGTDHQQQISVGGNLFDSDLAVFGGVADILRGRAFDVRKLISQSRNDVFSLIKAERSLGQIGYAIRIGHDQRFHLLR